MDDLGRWLSGASTVLLVGVGNRSRGDDGAGPLVAEKVMKWSSERFRVMNLEEAPGRLLPDAMEVRPSHILVVDAAMVGGPPGTMKLITLEEVESVSFSSTHDLPIAVTLGVVTSQTTAKAIVIGIQPQTTRVGDEMSEPVLDACERLSEALARSLRSAGVLE
jgi:hydrogenase 3 maturation protease